MGLLKIQYLATDMSAGFFKKKGNYKKSENGTAFAVTEEALNCTPRPKIICAYMSVLNSRMGVTCKNLSEISN